MAYTTEAIVREQSPFKDTSNIAATYIDRKIDEADSLIDSYIGEAYDLPLATTPAKIEWLSSKITALMLFLDQNTNIEVQPGVNVVEEWNQCIEELERIANRESKLFDDNGDELALADAKVPSFLPSNATSDPDAGEDYTPRQFTMTQKF